MKNKNRIEKSQITNRLKNRIDKITERDQNRQLPTERILQLLKRWMPYQYQIAQVVGGWVWIQFDGPQPRALTRQLAALGFHWNNKRQAWQHPCGKFTTGSLKEPREKYQHYFP